MDDQVLFTEQYMDEAQKYDDSYSSENEFISNSNCTMGRLPLTKIILCRTGARHYTEQTSPS